ncbi:MAG: V-type ATP synthase subunit B [Candidatus Micrarchaeia archaeon]
MNFEISYKTVERAYGPLIVVGKVRNAAYNEIVRIRLQNGEEKLGQVLDTSDTQAVVQVFGSVEGINTDSTEVTFLGDTYHAGVGDDMLGKIFNGQGKPIGASKKVVFDESRDINGAPINPNARGWPSEAIETGISAIDGLNTLLRGQKLPIFSGAGLAHNALVAQITRQATVKGKGDFAVVFAGIGITYDDAAYFMKEIRKTGAMERTAMFLNLASDPSIERILTPRLALTEAEYLAFEKGMHVLVLLDDMTQYAETLREISSAREEVPGRRGYPGYMYTDLASIYERAGVIKNKKGSITQLNVVTMPGDDVTHPIPDLTGYITEGQIFLSRELASKGIYPPIQPMGSLSRLMNNGIGKDKTREDHKGVADQLYGAYAKAQDARSISTIIGKEALSEGERLYLEFGDRFENEFIKQGIDERRSIEQTLDIGWDLLSMLPESDLTRIKKEYIDKYYKARAKPAVASNHEQQEQQQTQQQAQQQAQQQQQNKRAK